MIKLGLTGGICSGKSFVLDILKSLGCYTVRADEISKKIMFSPDSAVSEKIKKELGPAVFTEDSLLDKKKLGKIIFENKEKRQFINNLVHPLVKKEREKLFRQIQKTGLYNFFIYESALLVESATYKNFDSIIVVFTNPDEQIARLMERDKISRHEAETKIRAQFPLSEKLKVANYTIDTSGSFEKARSQTMETFHLIKKNFNID